MSELLGAWSVAIDVALAMPLETGLRVCLRACRLARRLDLDVDGRRRVYYLALLRHIGCTADNPELAGLVGDEIAFRSGMGTRDVSSSRALLPYLLQLTVGARPAAERPAALLHLLTHVRVMQRAGVAVCEVAQMLVDRIGFDDALRKRLREDLIMVYERYDGHGFPHRLGAADISLPAQIVQLAEAVTLHLQLVGREGALAMLRERRGRAFRPDVVDCLLDDAAALTDELDDPWAEVLAMEPGGAPVLDGERVDDVLVAMADFADLKSPYTAGHSRSVASLAGEAARVCGLPGADRTALRRAGWIHDIGRLSVSVAVWDKPGPLVRDDLEKVRLHPYVAERIFARSQFLAPLAVLAGAHHERVDGSGYHRAQRGVGLSVPARILAAADVYAALVAERSYRPQRNADEAARALRAEASAGRLDADAVDAVLAGAGHPARRRQAAVAGLTGREVEVLRLVARGSSNPEIAAELVVSRRTVEHHVEAVYAKLGVHSRSAVTLRALQSGLLSVAVAGT
jgi:HD-GYP domain-containing protein (c-di-GMP phosphodiesterase class II)/DNA-binding CsgD family transcriptional regulator